MGRRTARRVCGDWWVEFKELDMRTAGLLLIAYALLMGQQTIDQQDGLGLLIALAWGAAGLVLLFKRKTRR